MEVTTTETASYQIELRIGPAVTGMMTAFPIMSTSDLGQPVDSHLEVHIFEKGTGARLIDIDPLVRLTQHETGSARELATTQESGASQGVSFVRACLISKHREVQPHFGDNLYLPRGTYTITVEVGEETAEAQVSF